MPKPSAEPRETESAPAGRRLRFGSVCLAGGIALLVFYFIFAALILFTRWYLLPKIGDYRDEIAADLGKMTRSEASIGKIAPSWDGIWPRVILEDVRLSRPGSDGGADCMLELPRVEASFRWKSVFGTVAFRSLAVRNASLSIERTATGVFEVGGFALDSGDPNSGEDPLAYAIGWLMEQGRLDILDSSVSFIDRTIKNPRRVALADIHASFFRRGPKWHFGTQASLAGEGEEARHIDLRAEFHPSLFRASNDWRNWVGKAYFKADRLDLAGTLAGTALAGMVRKGEGSAEAWAEFDSGSLTSLTANLDIKTLNLHLGNGLKPLHITDASAQITEKHSDGVTTIGAKGLSYSLPGLGRKGPVDFEASLSGNGNSVTVSQADLRDIGVIIGSLPVPEELSRAIRSHRPRGTLTDAAFSWKGSASEPRDWHFRSGFRGLYIKAVADSRNPYTVPGIPGAANMAGTAEAGPEGGSIELSTANGRISLPGVFPLPEIALGRASGRITWSQEGGRPLLLKAENLSIANSDIAFTANGSWEDTGGAGTIDLRAEVSRAAAARAWRYMPAVLDADVRDWLKGGILGGSCTRGSAVLRGKLDDFPWTGKNQEGLFRTECSLKGGRMDFAPSLGSKADDSWPELTDINGTVVFEGLSMRVEADSAKTLSASIGKTSAEIPDLATSKAVLNISSTASARFSTFIEYLEKSPVGSYLGNTFRGAKAGGNASMALKLSIPLLKPSKTKVNGTLKLKGNSLTLAQPALPLTDITGSVSFTESGGETKGVSGTANGEPFSVTAERGRDGSTAIQASGTASPSDLLAFTADETVREALRPLGGAAPFSATVTLDAAGAMSVKVTSTMAGISSDYPVPLKKEAGESWPTVFAITPGSGDDAGSRTVSLVTRGRLEYIQRIPGASSGKPSAAALAVGRKAALPEKGFSIDIDTARASVDDWEPVVRRFIAASGDGASPGITRITARIGELQAGEMTFAPVDVSAGLDAGGTWSVSASSDHIDGYLKWNPADGGDIRGVFSRLHLPGNRAKEKTWEILEGRPDLPSMTIQVEDFAIGGMKFGTAAMKAKKTADSWKVTQFSLSSKAATLSATAEWDTGNTTRVRAELSLADGGKLLARLGYPGIIDGTSGRATAELNWSGPPWSPDTGTISGSTEIAWENGAIISADTGVAGTLLSLISFESLLRRIRLDFSDLAQKGFRFDSMTGVTTIGRGLCFTDNTKISGEQASIAISGVLDLNSKQLDYKAMVFPDIDAAGASVALAFVNPAVGIGTFLAQLLLRDPLSKALAATYSVTGPIDNPKITALGKPDTGKKESRKGSGR